MVQQGQKWCLSKLQKVIRTDNIESYVRDKMNLVVGCMAFGQYKRTFLSATEVYKTDRFGYAYQNVEGGEYWFTKDGNIKHGTCKWRRFYDYYLRGWLVG